MVRITRWLACAALSALGGVAYAADCTDLSRPACLQSHLEEEDRALNELYARLIDKSSATDKDQLRAEQRGWIRDRNSACNLPAGSTSASNWMATVAQEPGR